MNRSLFFFDSSGNVGQWIIMVMVLLLSIGVMRIWCRGLCPVGTILDFLARVKRKSKYCPRNCIDCQTEQPPLSNTDKLVAVCLGFIYIGIVWAIIEIVLLQI